MFQYYVLLKELKKKNFYFELRFLYQIYPNIIL